MRHFQHGQINELSGQRREGALDIGALLDESSAQLQNAERTFGDIRERYGVQASGDVDQEA